MHGAKDIARKLSPTYTMSHLGIVVESYLYGLSGNGFDTPIMKLPDVGMLQCLLC